MRIERRHFLQGALTAPFALAGDFPLSPWAPVFDTSLDEGLVRGTPDLLRAGGTFILPARSLVLFQHARTDG